MQKQHIVFVVITVGFAMAVSIPSRYTAASLDNVQRIDEVQHIQGMCLTSTVGKLFESFPIQTIIDSRVFNLSIPKSDCNYDDVLRQKCSLRSILIYLGFHGVKCGKQFFLDVEDGTLIITNTLQYERLKLPLSREKRLLILNTNSFAQYLAETAEWHGRSSVCVSDDEINVAGYGIDLTLMYHAARNYLSLSNIMEGIDINDVFRSVLTNASSIKVELLEGGSDYRVVACITNRCEIIAFGKAFSVSIGREPNWPLVPEMRIVADVGKSDDIEMEFYEGNLMGASCWDYLHTIDACFTEHVRALTTGGRSD